MNPKLMYYETMAVQWVSEGLTHFFSEIGYTFQSNTVQEINEAFVPLDRIYAARKNKELLMFALQFKAPYQRRDITCWHLDKNQHRILSQDYFSRFIWYCFPFMKHISSWKNALFHSHFVNPAICTHDVSWFMWDDYFLYFHPGGGGCNRFLENLRKLLCGPMPYRMLDKKLELASANGWNYTMSYDSWGSLFYKLLKSEIGFAIRNNSDYKEFVGHILGKNVRPLDDRAIIIAVDTVNQTVDAINIIASPKEDKFIKEEENIFPMEKYDKEKDHDE